MNYIYDIFLNYNDLAYEVFEWNKEDKISHIRKIPLIVISSLDLYNLINKKIIIDSSFLTKIYRKTEVFSKRDNYYLDYSFLATDKNEIIAFKLDKNGLIKQYSKLLVEEEIEVLNTEFDPSTSYAIAKAEAGEENKNKIIEVLSKGYKLGDKIVKYAQVKVGC